MWKLTCLLLICFYPYTSVAQFDLANQIFKTVSESIGNIGKLANPFGVGGVGFNHLASMNNLRASIQEQVNQNLAPVYAMSIKNLMARGAGGTTVVTYLGNIPRTFIVQDGIRRVCNGYVEGPRCLGSLEPFQVNSQQDLCYATTHAHVNNRICLSTGQINLSAFNGHVTCESVEGLPTLLVTMQQYRNLCGNRLPWEVIYRYYPNPANPRAVSLPPSNPYVRCLNNDPRVCEFEGDHTTSGGQGGSGFVSFSNSGFRFGR